MKMWESVAKKTQPIRLIRLWMQNEVLSMPNDSGRSSRISGNSSSDFSLARRNSSRKCRGNRKLLGAINMERGRRRRRTAAARASAVSLSLSCEFSVLTPTPFCGRVIGTVEGQTRVFCTTKFRQNQAKRSVKLCEHNWTWSLSLSDLLFNSPSRFFVNRCGHVGAFALLQLHYS